MNTRSATAVLARGAGRAASIVCLAAVAACASLPPVDSDIARGGLPGLTANATTDPAGGPLLTLGAGDAVTVQVFGRPELTTATTVAEDGSLTLPLAGAVPVAGLSPLKAGQRIAAAYRQGRYLVDPQVTVGFTQTRGQQVSVLGAVKTPGRYTVESRTTVLDLLAQAGGITENGSSMIVLLRPDRAGKVTRYAVDLKGLGQARSAVPTLTLRGGDSLFVPPAEQFYILGEVRAPNMYRLEPGMTVVQAISRGGGITPRGSDSRIELKRRKPDGTYVTGSADLTDPLQADDVIRVKERIF